MVPLDDCDAVFTRTLQHRAEHLKNGLIDSVSSERARMSFSLNDGSVCSVLESYVRYSAIVSYGGMGSF